MSTGRYSPTVAASYSRDQKWHDRWCEEGEWYDREGYDKYGYNREGRDRAGHSENDYLGSGQWVYYASDDREEYEYPLYEDTYWEWRNKFLGDLAEKEG